MTKWTGLFFRILIDAVLPLAIIAGAVVGMRALILKKPQVQVAERPPEAVLVDTEEVHETSPQIWITAYGTIEPAQEVALRPQVEGVVVEQNDRLVNGGLIGKGEMLLKIDPRDYELALEQREAALSQARASLKMEEGRRLVAKREWELLGDSVEATTESQELALRVPNYEESIAAVQSAESLVAQARLNLERTTIRAPFNCIVIQESVDTGQYLSSQNAFATLVGTDAYYVEASVPSQTLHWIDIPRDGQANGSPVTVIKDLEGSQTVEREGRVVGLLGEVDPNGRMARVRLELRDPLGLNEATKSSSPLLVGDYVRARIKGPVLDKAIEIPRLALREDDRVWIMNAKNQLEIHDADVLHRQEDSVIIRAGLKRGDHLIVSNLPEAVPGLALTDEQVTSSNHE